MHVRVFKLVHFTWSRQVSKHLGIKYNIIELKWKLFENFLFSSYVNDMEQFYIRYIKEKSCYAALNYADEQERYPNDSTKYTMMLKGRLNEFK